MADLNMRRWRARVLWAKGLWVLGGFHVSVGGRLDKTGAVAGRCPGDEAGGKPRRQGVCEPAHEPCRRGKGPRRKCQDFKPDRGITPSGIIGGLGKRDAGGKVQPSRNPKGGKGNPPPYRWRVRALSQPPPRATPKQPAPPGKRPRTRIHKTSPRTLSIERRRFGNWVHPKRLIGCWSKPLRRRVRGKPGAPQLYATGIAKQIAGDEEPARRDFDALQADPASWQARLELENSIAAKKADAN